MEERRRFERFCVNVPARIELPRQSGRAEMLNVKTENLSAGGVFLKELTGPFPEGEPVTIEIVLHFEELKTPADPEGALVISATGRLQRSGPAGTAIRFNEDYVFAPTLAGAFPRPLR